MLIATRIIEANEPAVAKMDGPKFVRIYLAVLGTLMAAVYLCCISEWRTNRCWAGLR